VADHAATLRGAPRLPETASAPQCRLRHATFPHSCGGGCPSAPPGPSSSPPPLHWCHSSHSPWHCLTHCLCRPKSPSPLPKTPPARRVAQVRPCLPALGAVGSPRPAQPALIAPPPWDGTVQAPSMPAPPGACPGRPQTPLVRAPRAARTRMHPCPFRRVFPVNMAPCRNHARRRPAPARAGSNSRA
jgi:hypothetical protein